MKPTLVSTWSWLLSFFKWTAACLLALSLLFLLVLAFSEDRGTQRLQNLAFLLGGGWSVAVGLVASAGFYNVTKTSQERLQGRRLDISAEKGVTEPAPLEIGTKPYTLGALVSGLLFAYLATLLAARLA